MLRPTRTKLFVEHLLTSRLPDYQPPHSRPSRRSQYGEIIIHNTKPLSNLLENTNPSSWRLYISVIQHNPRYRSTTAPVAATSQATQREDQQHEADSRRNFALAGPQPQQPATSPYVPLYQLTLDSDADGGRPISESYTDTDVEPDADAEDHQISETSVDPPVVVM